VGTSQPSSNPPNQVQFNPHLKKKKTFYKPTQLETVVSQVGL